MTQVHAVGEFLESEKVVHVGQDSLTPPPQVDDAGAETAGDLRPRQPGGLLEPFEGLGEVAGQFAGRILGALDVLAGHVVSPP